MPDLPNVQSFGRRPTPRARRRVFSPSTLADPTIATRAAEESFRGLEQAGADVVRIGQARDAFEERQRAEEERKRQAETKREVARAKSAFLTAKIEADNAFDEDQDYTTFESRYTERLAQAEQNALALVRDPLAREEFQLSIKDDIALGTATIRSLASKRGRDVRVASLDETLATNLDAALAARDPSTRRGIFEATIADVDAAVAAGDITAIEGGKRKRDYADSYAGRFLDTLPPEAKVQALQAKMDDPEARTGTFADFLPQDRVIAEYQKAEKDIRQERERQRALFEKAQRDAAEEALKEAYDREEAGSLDREYIESIRRDIKPSEYKSLLAMLDEPATEDDPEAFRDLMLAIDDDPEEAKRLALQMHNNKLIRNETLRSAITTTRSIARQEGPKSEYERSRDFIKGSLDPGPLVEDPAGRARLAEALDTFDRWVNREPRTDEEVAARGREIVDQFIFVDLRETLIRLPNPRFGVIRRSANDTGGILTDLEVAERETVRRHREGLISDSDLAEEARLFKRWREFIRRSGQQ